MGSRRPGPVGALGRAMPDPRRRHRPARQDAIPAQVTDGPAHPRADPGPSGAAGHGSRRPPGSRRTAARRRGHRARPAVHRAGQTLRRPARAHASAGRTWAQDPGGGKHRDLTLQEHKAFWTWAAVQVLRHTGIRIEELTELSHHSFIQYKLPASGELIPPLQIAPSKTDTERLLVISPELADVLSEIITRIRDQDGAVPLVAGYDYHERVWNPPMPLLFQRHYGGEHHAIGGPAIRELIADALASTGITDASGKPLRFVPHDFRRIFITDAIMHGMPPHIAQQVAGHRDIAVTLGYKAVYPEEVINAHRAFITRRRALRPAEEYRTPTEEEWAEFLGHFERRKLSLGTCGRCYATPCIHEHACIRCPLLRPDPVSAYGLTCRCGYDVTRCDGLGRNSSFRP
jgi:integrase